MHAARRFSHNVVLSLSGSILPAAVGVAGTMLLVTLGSNTDSVTVLTAWTLLGYMVLSDLGLTRSASKLVASGGTAADSIGALWRTALPLGVGLSIVVIVTALLVNPWLLILAPVPVLTSLQFPVVGALEALAKFDVLAGQRLLNAVCVYLLPPVAIAVLGSEYGIPVGFAVMTASRIVSLVYLYSRLDSSLRRTITATFNRTLSSHGSLIFWVGLSSVVGPAFLYADRLAVGIGPFSEETWVAYTALSELLLKSYVIPSAVLAVVFPWLATQAEAHMPLLRRLATRLLPLAAVAGTLLVVVLGLVLPASLVGNFAVSNSDETSRWVLIALVVATGVNWISQIYIAILQAMGKQRIVAVWQIALIAPFLFALVLAALSGQIFLVACVALGRVVLLSVILALSARKAIAHHPA